MVLFLKFFLKTPIFNLEVFMQKVIVFKDIKNKRWTVWSQDRTKHLGYMDELFMQNVTFFVDERKRQKIIKSKKRFPHAWIIGTLSKKSLKTNKQIVYNPYLFKHFVEKSSNKSRFKAKNVYLNKEGLVFC